MANVLRVGMFGGGVVGGGVYEILMKRGVPSALTGGVSVQITKICVKDINKPRSFDIDSAITALTTDPEEILNDESIDCIVEVMGGTTLAKTVVTEGLSRSKPKMVVTANKALLAEYLDELNELSAKAAAKKPRSPPLLAYEAAVCGGIPVIHLLTTGCYAGDVIHSISGICNGTTNYMLGKMEKDGYDYDAALKEAQDLGYAEADPTADVEGHDVRAKICILAKLAFGTTVKDIANVPCKGISTITSIDFDNAKELEATIKLVGTAQAAKDGDGDKRTLSVYVTPMMVPIVGHPLGSAQGSGNIVLIDSLNMALCSYSGPGAGRYPTANSVVADVCRFAKAKGQSDSSDLPSDSSVSTSKPFPLDCDDPLDEDYSAGSFYVRCTGGEAGGSSTSSFQDTAAKYGLSIKTHNEKYVLTGPGKVSSVQAFSESIGASMFMPYIA